MKKRLCAVAIVMICFSVLASTTIAYFTDVDTARNVITSGGIEVNVIEQQSVDGSPVDYPGEPIPVMPGTTVSKIVSVQSTEQAAWVRVSYTVAVYGADGEEMDVLADELEKVIVIESDTNHWTMKDGWWYYDTPIQSGEITEPLFEEVQFSGPEMDNKYQSSTVVINVKAQAVQTTNNGKTIWEALGWPEE